jgi:hypothetical protein
MGSPVQPSDCPSIEGYDIAKDKGTEGTPGLSLTDGGPLSGPLVPLVTPARVILGDDALGRLARSYGREPDGYFPCPIPSHTGRATLVEKDGQSWLGCCLGRRRSLAEVRAACAYGEDGKLSNIELATWWRRLAWELGDLDPAEVVVPALGEPSAAACVVLKGFVLLLGLRRTDHPPRPLPFAVRFAAAWCGIGKNPAHEGIKGALSADLMRIACLQGRMPLYEIGEGKQ